MPELPPDPATQAPPADTQPSAASAPPEVVQAATTRLVEFGLLEQPSDTLTPEVLAVLQFIIEQAGIPVDLSNPQELMEFLNVVASGPPGITGSSPGAAPGADPGAAPGNNPSGVEPIEPAPGGAGGLSNPGPKRISAIPGGGGLPGY